MKAFTKILVVDDNPQYLLDALPMYGYEVSVATDGIIAMKMLSNDPKIDLILLDVMMPNMDGWATLKAIREKSKFEHIPIIMLTAVNEDQKQVFGLKHGADDYIVKPFVLPNLLVRIEALLRRSKWSESASKNVGVKFKDTEQTLNKPLSKGEKQVLKLATEGLSNEQISETLDLSVDTVKSHLYRAYKKMNVNNRTQAILMAIQMKLVDD